MADNDVQNAIWEVLDGSAVLARATQLGTTKRIWQAWPPKLPVVDSTTNRGFITLAPVAHPGPHFLREEEQIQISIFSKSLNRNKRVQATVDGLVHRQTLTMDDNWWLSGKRIGVRDMKEAQNNMWHTAITVEVKYIAK